MKTREREWGTMEYWPETPEERIEAFKKIVERQTYAKIDGCMIDITTANIVVKIYDALSPTNQEKFRNMKADKMGMIAFKLLK